MTLSSLPDYNIVKGSPHICKTLLSIPKRPTSKLEIPHINFILPNYPKRNCPRHFSKTLPAILKSLTRKTKTPTTLLLLPNHTLNYFQHQFSKVALQITETSRAIKKISEHSKEHPRPFKKLCEQELRTNVKTYESNFPQ
jgi:hypothetical protein